MTGKMRAEKGEGKGEDQIKWYLEQTSGPDTYKLVFTHIMTLGVTLAGSHIFPWEH